jgi:hypothetical protein
VFKRWSRLGSLEKEQIEEEKKEPLPDRVAEALIEKTDVKRSTH